MLACSVLVLGWQAGRQAGSEVFCVQTLTEAQLKLTPPRFRKRPHPEGPFLQSCGAVEKLGMPCNQTFAPVRTEHKHKLVTGN